MQDPVDVLIVGAGPTGLALALWLARRGVRLRIIDRLAEPGTTSRALGVQGRTLEFYRQLGIADRVVERGHRTLAVNLWVAGRKVAHATLGDMGAGISRYPYLLIYPQDEHERMLIDRLAEAGVHVERPLELVKLQQDPARVQATLKRPDGTLETCNAAWLAGCDGAHSTVREQLGIRFPGGTYEHVFYVADVQAAGPTMNGELHVGLDRADFLALFPLKDDGRVRLVGTVRDQPGDPRDGLSWEDVNRRVLGWLKLDVTRVNWFSTYRVHHRVVDHFRRGRAFLAGDAAHVHSPVGGQGMNTGIGDSVDLAWKLADVVQGRASESILESYEPERIAFARRLVATTDQGFTGATASGIVARFVRLRAFPMLLPIALSLESIRRFFYRTISQTAIEYHHSALSQGAAGGVHGGDRLPWIPNARGDADNYEPLASMDWQVHVYGEPNAALLSECASLGLPLYAFPWQSATRDAGFERNAYYLMRPDGYVALAKDGQDTGALVAYLAERGIRLNPGSQPGGAGSTSPRGR